MPVNINAPRSRAAEEQKAKIREKSGNAQVLALLEQIGARLIASERERMKVRNTMDEYREMFADLEDKTMLTEKAYVTIQNKLSKREAQEERILKRQEALEQSLSEKMERIEKAAALADRFDELMARQERLARRLEKIGKERVLLDRKIDRIEDAVSETQNVMHDRAREMLAGRAPANEAGLPVNAGKAPASEDDSLLVWWQKRSFRVQAGVMASVVFIAALIGWSASLYFNPADMNRGAESPQPQRMASSSAPGESAESAAPDDVDLYPATSRTVPEGMIAGNALGMSDAERLAAFEADPQALAAQLNDIEPQTGVEGNMGDGAARDSAASTAQTPSAPAPESSQESSPVAIGDDIPASAFDGVDAFLAAQKSPAPLAERLKPDPALSPVIREIEKRAFEGLPEAQHDLAAIYTAGHGGVEINYTKAAQWFLEAALQGVGNARYNLGVLYHQGLGVPRDLDMALQWYRAAAKEGHPEAEYNLGISYIEGLGADYNPALAAAFFKQAADGGVMEAAYNLGLIYENGLLGDVDTASALRWYQKAAEAGSAEAQRALEQLSASTGQVTAPAPVASQPAAPAEQAEGLRLVDVETAAAEDSARAVRAVIAQIQEQLMRQGLYPGPADGVMGALTADAIRSYQGRYDLPRTGEASEALLVHMLTRDLEVAAGAEYDGAAGDLGSRAE